MEVRRARPDEGEDVRRVIADAFGDGGAVAALWDDVVGRGLARASLVAVGPDGVEGHVGVSDAWLDARRELVDVLMLSPLSVRPHRQRTGVGTALVAAAIRTAERLAAPALFLEGSPAYYGRRGFARAADSGFEAPSRRTPEPAFQVVLLPGHEAWMTGRLIYRDVWWEHDAAGLRDPELTEIERALGVEGP